MTTELKERIEQLECQLAGCMTAATGWAKDPPKQGDWGWSKSFQDVLDLRTKYEALLAQHAVAEPPFCGCEEARCYGPITGYSCRYAIAEPPAHAAGQPKLTELSFETWWGWFKGGYGETGVREEDIARCAWIQSKAVQRALLTSPVAPPPPRESNSERSVREMDEYDATLSPSRRCYKCGHTDVWHQIGVGPCNKLDRAKGAMCTCLKFVPPPLAPGEQPQCEATMQVSSTKMRCRLHQGHSGICYFTPPAPPAQERASDETLKTFEQWWFVHGHTQAPVGTKSWAEQAWATAAKQAREGCADKLEKVAAQCEAGGHTSRGKMFRAIAAELRTK